MLQLRGEGAAPPRILHVGCGSAPLPDWLQGEEVRLDIDPQHKPDIVASMTDIPEDIGGFSLVYTNHSLEHLYPHDLPRTLAGFLRVLAPGGIVIAVVPDLEDIRPTEDVVYVSPSGPVTGLDMYYGARWLLHARPHMAHHNGFVAATLRAALERAGFANVRAIRDTAWNLIGIGEKAA